MIQPKRTNKEAQTTDMAPLDPLNEVNTTETPQPAYEASEYEKAMAGFESYDRYAQDSFVGMEEHADSDRKVIIEEAVRGAMEDGFYNTKGEWTSGKKLDDAQEHWLPGSRSNIDGDEEKMLSRTVGWNDRAGQGIKDLLGSGNAQQAKNTWERRFGWVPGNSTIASTIFETNGFVPQWDEEKGRFVLKETSLDRDSLEKAQGKILSAYGSTERDPNVLYKTMESFAVEISKTPQVFLNALEAGTDVTQASINWATGKGFKDEEDWLNKLNDDIRKGDELYRNPDNMLTHKGIFGAGANTAEALGSGLASLVQFGLTGGIGRVGAWAAVKGAGKVLGQKGLKKGMREIAQAQLKKKALANTFGNLSGGMVINTGYTMREAKNMGLSNADAAAVSLAIGAVSSIIETKLGANKLNNWLIGSKGGATKEMIKAVSKETGGDLSADAIGKALTKPTVLNRIASQMEALIPQGLKEGVEKTATSLGKGASKVGGATNKAMYQALSKAGMGKRSFLTGKNATIGTAKRVPNMIEAGAEEGSEEFLQSLVGHTFKYLYNNFLAEEGSVAGKGKFDPQGGLMNEHILASAFEEFAIGAIMGGMMGGFISNQQNEDRDISSLVASGHTGDILDIMKSLKDTGKYTDEQYQYVTKKVMDMENVWKNHEDEVRAAEEGSQIDLAKRQKRGAAALRYAQDGLRAQKSIDELLIQRGEIDSMNESAEKREKLSSWKNQMLSYKANKYAADEQLKSIKDKNRVAFSDDLRYFEGDSYTRKGLTLEHIAMLEEEISSLELDPEKNAEAIASKKTQIKGFKEHLKTLNHLISNFKVKSYRQVFDNKVEKAKKEAEVKKEAENETNKAEEVDTDWVPSDLHLTTHTALHYDEKDHIVDPLEGFRYANDQDDINELKKQGYDVTLMPSNQYITNAPAKEPAQEGNKEAETKKKPKEDPKDESEIFKDVAQQNGLTENPPIPKEVTEEIEVEKKEETGEVVNPRPPIKKEEGSPNSKYPDWIPNHVAKEMDWYNGLSAAQQGNPNLKSLPRFQVLQKAMDEGTIALAPRSSDSAPFQLIPGLQTIEAAPVEPADPFGGISPLGGTTETEVENISTRKAEIRKTLQDISSSWGDVWNFFQRYQEMEGEIPLTKDDPDPVGYFKRYGLDPSKFSEDGVVDGMFSDIQKSMVKEMVPYLEELVSLGEDPIKDFEYEEREWWSMRDNLELAPKPTIEDAPTSTQQQKGRWGERLNSEGKIREKIIPYQFQSLFLHPALAESAKGKLDRKKAFKDPNMLDNLEFRIKDQYTEIARNERDKGTPINQGKFSNNAVEKLPNASFADIEIVHTPTGAVMGAIENPYKWTLDGKRDGKPLLFSDLTFEEFTEMFDLDRNHNEETFEQLAADQKKLIALRERIHRIFGAINTAEKGKGEVVKASGFLDMRSSFSFKKRDTKPDSVLIRLEDASALRNKDGKVVIFDRQSERFISETPDFGDTPTEGSRYQALMEQGPFRVWINLVPKANLEAKETADYIKGLNDIFNQVRLLDPTSIRPDSALVKELEDKMNTMFINTHERGMYFKFTAQLVDFKAGNGKKAAKEYRPVLVAYSVTDSKKIKSKDLFNLNHFAQLTNAMSDLMGVPKGEFTNKNFRKSIPKDVKPNDRLAEDFTILQHEDVIDNLSIKLDIPNMRLPDFEVSGTSIADTDQNTVDPKDPTASYNTKEGLFEAAEKEGWSPDRMLSELKKFNSEQEQNDGKKFARIEGLRAYNSNYIIKYIATQLSKDKRVGVSDRDKILSYIDTYLKGLTPASLGDMKFGPEMMRHLDNMSKEQLALESDTNKELIIREVKKKFTGFLQATDADLAEDERESSEAESDSLGIKELTEIPAKLSAAIKDFIALQTVEGTDRYGRKTEVLVDFDKNFNKILHNLANTTDQSVQLKRLKMLAKYDEELAVITRELLSLGEDHPVYKGFFREFTKFRMDYLQVVAMPGKVNVYNGIQRDSDKILLERWKRGFYAKHRNLTKERREELSARMGWLMRYKGMVGEKPAESDVKATKEYLEKKDEAKKWLSKQVPDHLNNMSKRKNGPAEIMVHTFNQLGVELPLQFAAMSMDGEAFGDIDMMSTEDIANIRRSLTNWDLDSEGMFSEEGQLGLFGEFAKNAVGFSNDLFEKTFKDAEKKTRYAFVSPNYLLQRVHDIMNNGLSAKKHVHNYIAQLANIKGNELMLKDMQIAMVGDIRTDEYAEGKTYKSLGPADFMLNRHSLFNSYLTGKKTTVRAVYQPFVIAEKRSSYGVTFPTNFEFMENGEVTEKAVSEFFNSVFKGEFQRMKDILKDPDLGMHYNTFINDEKIKTSPFAFLTELNENQELVEAMAKAEKVEDIEEMAREALRNMLEGIVNTYEADLKKYPDTIKKNRKVYDKGFREGQEMMEDTDRTYAGIFALNDTLIRIAFSELVQGDAAIVKNEIDRVKRASGMNAAGAAVTSGPIKVAYVSDTDLMVDGERVNRKKGEEYKSATDDAIVWVTAEYRKRIESDMGRLTKKQEEIYDKIIAGEKLETWEVKEVDLISSKTVYYTPEIYNKKSDQVLTRALTSVKVEGKWVAQKGREKLHNMLEWMEANKVEQLITYNATKGRKHTAVDSAWFSDPKFNKAAPVPTINVRKKKGSMNAKALEGYFKETMLDGQYERLQLENKSKSAKGVFDMSHPTQAVELMPAELSGMGAQALKDRMNYNRKAVMQEQVKFAKEYLTHKNEKGELDIDDFIEKAFNTLSMSQESEEVLQYLVSENGKFKHSLNLPHLEMALSKIMVSHFNKGVLRDKMPGAKVTIVPSGGLGPVVREVKDAKGNITEEIADPVDVLENPEKYIGKEWKGRELKLHDAVDGKTQIAEIMITRRSANLMDLKPGDTIPAEALEIFGVRIPSQWYHSMIAAKVVGFLPDTHGDIAALPAEMPLIAGEDFDVDARYLMIKEGYWEKNAEGNNKTYKLYGSAETKEEKWDEYWRYNTGRSEIKLAAKKILENDNLYQKTSEDLQQLNKQIFDIQAMNSERFEDQQALWASSSMDFHSAAIVSLAGKGSVSREAVQEEAERLEQDLHERLGNSSKILKYDANRIKALKEKRTDLQTAMANMVKDSYRDALDKYGLIGDFDSFSKKRGVVIVPAKKNDMISTYIDMFLHESIQDRLKVPASVDRMVDSAKWINGLFGNLDKEGNVKESSNMLVTPSGMMDAWWNNVSGAANIANVASMNINVAYATQNDLQTGFGIVLDGKIYDSFGNTKEDDYNPETGEIEFEIEFKWDGISTTITAMTDNAKERLAAMLNLDQEFVSLATVALGLGLGFNRTMLLFNQPAFRHMKGVKPDYTSMLEGANSLRNQLKSKFEEFTPNSTDPDSRVMEKAASLNTILPNGSSLWEDLMDRLNSKEKMIISDEHLELLYSQVFAMENMANLVKTQQGMFNIGKLLGTKKGFKDTERPEAIQKADKNLRAKNIQDRIFNNSVEVLDNDPMIGTYLKATKDIEKAWGEHMFLFTPKMREVAKAMKHLTPKGRKGFNHFLVVQAFKKSQMDNHGIDLSKENHLLYKNVEGGDTLLEMLKTLAENNPDILDNEFIKALKVTPGSESSNMQTIGVDTFTQTVDSLRDDIANGLDELFKSKNPEEEAFAQAAIRYLIVKDNFKFKKDSFVGYLSPDMLEFTMKELNIIQEDLVSNRKRLRSFRKGFWEMVDDYMEIQAMVSPESMEAFDFTKQVKHPKSDIVVTQGYDKETKKQLRTVKVSKGTLVNSTQYLFRFEGNKAIPIKHQAFHVHTGDIFGESLMAFKLKEMKESKGAFELVYESVPRVNMYGQEVMHMSPEQILELAPQIKVEQDVLQGLTEGDGSRDIDESDVIDSASSMDLTPPPGFGGNPFTNTKGLDLSMKKDESSQESNPFIGVTGLDLEMKKDGDMPKEESNPFVGIQGLNLSMDKNTSPAPKPAKKPLPKHNPESSTIADTLKLLVNKKMTHGEFLDVFFENSPYRWMADRLDARKDRRFSVQTGNSKEAQKEKTFGWYWKGEVQIHIAFLAEFEKNGNFDLENLELLMAHEMLHSLTDQLSTFKKKIMREELTKFYEDLKKYMPRMDDRLLEIMGYIEGDVEELVTYAFTDKKFAEFLNSIEGESKDGNTESFWARLKRIILDRIESLITGPTKLDDLMNVMDQVFANPTGPITGPQASRAPNSGPQFRKASSTIHISENDVEDIRDGHKTMTYMDQGRASRYTQGEIYEATTKGKDLGIYLKIENIYDVKNFNDLTQEQKDAFAVALGRKYSDFADLKDSLKNGGNFADFINGKKPGFIVSYKQDTQTLASIEARAKASNPAKEPLKKLFNEVTLNFQKQIDDLHKSSVDSTFKKERTEKLEGALALVRETEDLLDMVGDAKEDLAKQLVSLKKFVERITKGEFSDKAAIEILFNFKRLVSSYGFIEEVNKEVSRVVAESPKSERESTELSRDLGEAAKIRNDIQNLALATIKPIMAKKWKKFGAKVAMEQIKKDIKYFLERRAELDKEVKDGKLKGDEKEKRFKAIDNVLAKLERILGRGAVDEADILALMDHVEYDTGVFGYWLGAAEQSEDPIIALYALETKEAYENGRQDTRIQSNPIQAAYDAFIKERGSVSSSMEKLYESLYTIVELDNGDTRIAFTTQKDEKKFKEAKDKYVESLDLVAERKRLQKMLPGLKNDPMRQWEYSNIREILLDKSDLFLKNHLGRKWERKNSELKSMSERAEALERKKMEFRNNEDFMLWARRSMNTDALIEMGILTGKVTNEPKYNDSIFRTPGSNFVSDKWLSMYNMDGTPKNKAGEFHQLLYGKFKEYQAKLPIYKQQGDLVPGIQKLTSDRVFEGQKFGSIIKGEWKNWRRNLMENVGEDRDYGSDEAFGGSMHEIPVYYKNDYAPEDTSVDLASSVLKFIDMVNEYEARRSVFQQGLFLVDIMRDRAVGQQTPSFNNKFDEFAHKYGKKRQHIKEKGQDKSSKRLVEFVEMHVFGNVKEKQSIYGFRYDKALGMLMGYASRTAFALPIDAGAKIFMGASSNFFQQITQQFIEAQGKSEGVTMKTILTGQKLMWKHGREIFLSDFGKDGLKSKAGQIIDLYDAIQGQFSDTIGNRISGSKLRKFIQSSPEYVHRYLSEVEPQLALFLGILSETMVNDGNGGKISLLDAYELVDESGNLVEFGGSLQLKKGVQFTELDQIKLMNRMHAMNKYINGVYNSFSKSVLEKYALGRALLFFRKYLYSGMRRRFAGDFIDYEQDRWARGYATGFWKAAYRELAVMKNIKFWEKLSPREREDGMKVAASFLQGLSHMMIAGILKMIIDDDDDDNDLVYNYLLYNAVRLNAETWSFWNPIELMRITKSPTILTTYVDRFLRVGGQLTDPMAVYERKWGPYEKGDSKLKAKLVKLMVGQTSYSSNPDMAVKVFEDLLR